MDRRTLPLSMRPSLCQSKPLAQTVLEPVREDIPAMKPVKTKKGKATPIEPLRTTAMPQVEVIKVMRRG